MKISIESSGTIDVLGIEEGFAAIKNAGMEAVDFNLAHYFTVKEEMDEGYYEALCDKSCMMAYFEQVKAASKKYGVEIGQCHAPFPTYFPRSVSNTEVVQKMIRKSIEMCSFLECKYLVIHPIFDGSARFPSLTKQQEMDLNIEFYTSLIPALKKYNVICCLENMFAQDWGTKKVYIGSCSDMNEAVWYIDTLNEKAGEKCFAFCLDIGHAVLLGVDPCFAMEKLGYRLEVLHIHDNKGYNDDHITPYLGIVNWKRFIKGLKEIGYKGNLNFETSSGVKAYPKELITDVLKLISATGRYFRNLVLAED